MLKVFLGLLGVAELQLGDSRVVSELCSDKCTIPAIKFFNWEKDEVQSLTFTQVQKQNTNDKKPQIHEKFNIAVAYHQVACQLATELSIVNNINNHEAHQHQAYAR